MYPRINIDLNKYGHNVRTLSNYLSYLDELYAVTKVFCAQPQVINCLYQNGIRRFADSRLKNLKKIKAQYPYVQTLLLRLPMKCEIEEVVKYADRSLNSEIETIAMLNDACEKLQITHDIILMIDLGDLREGIMFDSDYLSQVKEILTYKNINLVGVGTNVTCYGSIIPTFESLSILEKIKDDIEANFDIKLPIISGGNSSSIYLHFSESGLPKKINSLRVGDAFMSGIEASYLQEIPNMNYDCVQLEAQIIEIKDKPSYPIGLKGVNAFGEKVEYEDVGIHTRAILAIGRQDVSADDLIPIDEDITILGSSSDHLIIEINKPRKLGDTIIFNLKYGGVLSLMTSEYVEKNYLK